MAIPQSEVISQDVELPSERSSLYGGPLVNNSLLLSQEGVIFKLVELSHVKLAHEVSLGIVDADEASEILAFQRKFSSMVLNNDGEIVVDEAGQPILS